MSMLHGCAVITVHRGNVGIVVSASVLVDCLRSCTTEICMKVHSQYGELRDVLRLTSLRAYLFGDTGRAQTSVVCALHRVR